MKPIASVSFEDESGQVCRLTIEQERAQYVLRKRLNEDFTSLQTFATKTQLRTYLQSLTDRPDEEGRALTLLYAQFAIEPEDLSFELRDLNRAYPFGLILIGSFATYLRTRSFFRSRVAESTREIACYVSREQYRSIRDCESVIPNPSLQRSEMRRDSLKVTLYVEGEHRLAISYEDIDRHSSLIEGIRVAAQEHLLILTIDVAMSAVDLAEGREAREDLVALVLSLSEPNGELLATALDEKRLSFLRDLGQDAKLFGEMLSYSPYVSDVRQWFNNRLDQIEDAIRYGAEMIRHKSELARLQHVSSERRYANSANVKPLSPNLNLLPVRVGSTVCQNSLTTIRHLCNVAGISDRYSGASAPFVAADFGTGNLRALDEHGCSVYVVDHNQFTARTPGERMLRILEVIAYSFHDFDVRECVEGLFR